MSTTVAQIIQWAKGYSVLSNTDELTQDATEMIVQVASFERDIYRAAAAANRYFHASTTLTSTSGSSGRTVTLTATPPIERIIRAQLDDTDTVLAPVDVEDPDAELPPRYYILGQTMHEVEDDWGATGTVDIVIDYASQPAALTVTGLTSQTVSLPDQFVDLLAMKLAQYFAMKDVGRDATEVERLEALYQARLAHVMDALEHFGGTTRRRFLSPFKIPGGSGE